MINSISVLKKRKPIFLAVIATFILFSICLSFILMLNDSFKQREILETTYRYMTFESKVERLISSNVTMLQGYEAYIKSNPDLDEDSNYIYLNDLLSKNSDYIRNIGIIKDTTIIWNYPKTSNSAAIGVDLSKIKEQRDIVLQVKTNHKPVLQGPVNLVQGGSGFIVRLPIVRDDTGYWGQISIVLNSEKILEQISSYAESSGLNIAIFNQESKSVPFFGSVSPYGNFTLKFDIDPNFINWNAYVYLPIRWSVNPMLFVFLMLFSAGVAVFVGVLVYQYMESNYKLLNMSTHDFLTGLYNRHFLNEYQTIVISAAKRENRKAAIILLDLNDFKKINDTYGHGIGDKVLVEVSRILKGITRINEAAFRLGGDEFLLILPEIENSESLQAIKERILKHFEQEFSIYGYPIKVTLSIGCALYPEDGEDLETLLHVADQHMYLEKSKR